MQFDVYVYCTVIAVLLLLSVIQRDFMYFIVLHPKCVIFNQ